MAMISLAAEAHDDVAQRPIVHVHRARPVDVVDVDAELVPVVQVAVEDRGEQIVRGGDGVDVAVEVQVDHLRRQHL